MIFYALLVIFCCVSVIKSETCFGKDEKSILAGIRSSLKALEDRLNINGKSQGCSAGWKEYNNHCYYFSNNKTTWFEAERICRNMGAYLVKVTDAKENSWIKNIIITKSMDFFFLRFECDLISYKKESAQNYWMGAQDQLKEGEWRWVSDQSKVQYSGWSNGEPNNTGGNEDCVLFYLPCSSNWNDGRCHFPIGDPSALLSPKCTAHSQ
ncbi:Perlucin-like protein [Mytilus edulis]|uniref:Perlucin-like protein n=1 Tax=Mytilus edulis TaxID=6550 RepID=A0A8S3RRI4_MYTED|nr:Perlucin-like protein [Mytilus edulis]